MSPFKGHIAYRIHTLLGVQDSNTRLSERVQTSKKRTKKGYEELT